jgi:hypothetical protein
LQHNGQTLKVRSGQEPKHTRIQHTHARVRAHTKKHTRKHTQKRHTGTKHVELRRATSAHAWLNQAYAHFALRSNTRVQGLHACILHKHTNTRAHKQATHKHTANSARKQSLVRRGTRGVRRAARQATPKETSKVRDVGRVRRSTSGPARSRRRTRGAQTRDERTRKAWANTRAFRA